VVWPAQLRRASLCPRLMLYEAEEGVQPRIWHGGDVVNGELFHAQIAEPLFKDLANKANPRIEELMRGPFTNASKLRSDFWRVFVQSYLCAEITDESHLGNNPSEQVMAFSKGLGEFAGYLTRTYVECSQTDCCDGEDLIFMPPEQLLEKSIQREGLGEITLRGRYDGLIFNQKRQEYTVIDFKCKENAIFEPDLLQLAAYAWLIQQATKLPVGGVLIYVQPEPETREISPQDLAQVFGPLEDLIETVAQMLADKRDENWSDKPVTSHPGLCKICPLDPECDLRYGQRP